MAENRTPDDLQEAVAATLRRLRGEVGKTGTGSPAPQQRIEPQLSVTPAPVEIMPAAAGEAPPPAQPAAEPDLLSRAQPEIPPAPTPRQSIRETLASQGREPSAPRGSMRLVPYALSFAAIVVFAGIVWWAYQAVVGGHKNGPVPVITADNTPAKVAPSDQSATDTNGQQQTVYDQISGGTANQPKPEVLLPAPDTPQTPPPPPTPTPSASDVSGTATTTGETTAGGTATATTGTDTGSTNTAASTAATGSTAGTTNTASTDTSGTTTQTLIPPPAPLAPSTTGTASTGTAAANSGSTTTTADAGSTATGATDTTSTDSGSVNTNASTDAGPAPYEVPTLSPLSESATTPDVTAPAATTTTTSTDTTTTADAGSAATTGTVADNYRIQLAAVKSQADADKAWKRILAKHTDVLGSLTVHIVRADLGTQGIYYRVQAGPFADKASAQSVCDQLKSSGQQCLVKP